MAVAKISPTSTYRANLARPRARFEPRYDFRRHQANSLARLIHANQRRRRQLNRWLKRQGLSHTIDILECHDDQSYLVIQASPLAAKQLNGCPHLGQIDPIEA